MRLLAVFALFTLPLTAFAQSVPLPIPFDTTDSLTVLHPAPGFDYLYDTQGRSTSIYETAPGFHWYSTEDRYGQIRAQGFLFDPVPAPQPLKVPESMRYEPPERRR